MVTVEADSEELGFPEGKGVTGSVLGVSDGLSDIALIYCRKGYDLPSFCPAEGLGDFEGFEVGCVLEPRGEKVAGVMGAALCGRFVDSQMAEGWG